MSDTSTCPYCMGPVSEVVLQRLYCERCARTMPRPRIAEEAYVRLLRIEEALAARYRTGELRDWPHTTRVNIPRTITIEYEQGFEEMPISEKLRMFASYLERALR